MRLQMVLVPAEEFIMGSDEDESDRLLQSHTVPLVQVSQEHAKAYYS
jgi:formylglycine-generating enzyme required for sulfatase activity